MAHNTFLKIWLKSIQAFDQTEKLLLFDRISVAVIADDNTETYEIVNVIADDKR